MKNEASDPVAQPSRRDFLRLGAATALGVGMTQLNAEAAAADEPAASKAASMIDVPFTAVTPRIGMIGTGGRGTNLLENLLAADAKVLAICDVVREKAEHAQSLVVKAGQPSPELYTNGQHHFEALVARDDLDLVIIATPWDWHVHMAVAVMEHGKHAAVEVPAATTMEDCWRMVDTSEQTRKHCMMLEKCCYGANETTVLRMAHPACLAICSMERPLISTICAKRCFRTRARACGGALSIPAQHGNIYPTHGIGPVANYMGINRGDRFDYMVSMSTPAARAWLLIAKRRRPRDDPSGKRDTSPGI